MITRAGKLMADNGLWVREKPQEDRGPNVCKTIMFKRKDGQKIAVLIPLNNRVSYKKLKAHYGQDVSPLSADELRAEGFEPHECAPMLMQCELIVDPDCEQFAVIQTGSGTLGYGIEWHFSDLKQLKQYITLDVKELK
jgi:prolyl-tRNA editing enzyme YbaK/EbsC (Cys-tRNA(Pro) deacylase)